MSFDAPAAVLFLVGQLIVAAAIWGGIRADIKGMHLRLDSLERRFDSHMTQSLNDTWHGVERRGRGNQ